jgi:diguanylate cyclase (GGDEF)-like protein/PAS domain S-box-containing protein
MARASLIRQHSNIMDAGPTMAHGKVVRGNMEEKRDPRFAPEQQVDVMHGADVGAPVLSATHANGAVPQASQRIPGDNAARLEQEQAYANDLYLLAPVGYFVLAADATIVQANLIAAELIGIDRAKAQVHNFRSFVTAPFQADFDQFIARALASRATEQCSLQMTSSRQHSSFPVKLLASAGNDGRTCRVVVELAEGKLAALERNEERFRRIVHNAEEGIWEIDALANTSFVNPKMAAMLGYTIEEMLGKPLQGFMDDEGRAITERNVNRRQQGISERHEFKFVRKDGQELWTTLATNPIFDSAGTYVGALALVTDITEKRQSAELVWHQANFDHLTGLPNRHMFIDRLSQERRKAERSGSFLALLFLDLDHFKEVNDRLGHATGDALLVEAARRIAACVRATDTLARLGGDEFTVILAGIENVNSVERIAQALIASLSLPFVLGEEQAQVSASIGIALYPSDADGVDDLLARADQAMYAAKHAGRNRYSYFTRDLQEAAHARMHIARDLREAIARGQFEIAYQPIVSLQTGVIEKAEALLRWRHPTRGLLQPVEFLPFAESSGMIVEIGDWVFRQVAQQVQRWQRSLAPSFQVSVNKSPVQFRRDPELVQGWLDCLAQLALGPGSIVIEITESVLLDGASQVLERLTQYRAMGLQVALDDFGTGYSSLSHLKKFDIDYLKIDQSFVARLEAEGDDLALCEAIVLMAHKLGLKVVAEGVETQMQRALLTDAGCDYAQGFAFSAAVPAEAFEAMAHTAIARLPHFGLEDKPGS